MELGIALIGDGLEQGGADAVGSHMTVGIGGNGDAGVQVWSVVRQVLVEIVRVDGVSDVGGD